ncbi:MAG: hypothetical protein KF723_01115 [Rhizobiaceae bacterium]|nr:hypothetical protein [Rhizobiaceae bacterium]
MNGMVVGMALAFTLALPMGAAVAADAMAKEETDVYDSQSANGNVIATLREGTMVDLGACGGTWCAIVAGPGKGGFVRAVAMNMNPGSMSKRQKAAAYPREVKVLSDVDIYEQRGGGGRVIGILRQGTTTLLRQCSSDNWCPVSGGWVWGDFLAR